MNNKKWRLAEIVPEEFVRVFPELLPVLAQLLWNRGIKTRAEVEVFLEPDWSRDTHDPFLFQQMRPAVDRVFLALEKGQVITIHGDYDADGVCGTAVMFSTLRDICRGLKFDEKKLTTYIPHREREGYGLFPATADHLHEHEKTNLLITVDCGISNADAVARARELGMDTIICDHHAVPEVLPEALILHSQVPGELYPNKVMCGAAVAFKLASALIIEARRRGANFSEGYEKWLLDLVAIATVTDIMPLFGENRVLETYGLTVLKKTRRLGLKKLLVAAGVKNNAIDSWTIGFQIGPRLNAAGRMDHADPAFRLLVSEDEQEAEFLASELQAANVTRQKRSNEIYKEALAQIGEPGDQKILIAAGEGWPAGLVGLVAGKISNNYSRPVIIAAKDGDKFTGSGRSIPGFDVTAALTKASVFLDRFGGHPQACGFSATTEEKFKQAMEVVVAEAEKILKPEDLVPEILIDAEIPLKAADWDLELAISKMAPFGEGNRSPIFVSRGLQIVSFETMGLEGKHLRLSVRDLGEGIIKKMIAFGFGSLTPDLRIGTSLDVAYEIGVNEWNGDRELQLKVVDLKITASTTNLNRP
ncbi:MAG: Single-stranded-DNA-specific exonuclease RecJ [Candidatus Uhrbacteria bacterium GW2011_GWE2_45_35]|uniref:Single-stranded-DNA-specific exonuclease RecJ n=2 Tax=Candidatus Uhriibacteriota TaxID=1752732 RepID=A0A0G1JIA0_9BACT|nr:MAG: Single-stranded-DNA-specific exonuclease RecJ [Candidatus Uhrbacteria bacterium GW2011_GWF2_44_350]KKU07592.1 MAG: Single-stranded-DNA-specific exonuclease RecJ [Candidatus Uhrbacteria bacterium GW2011_GWE2_45_35]HBR80238.1 single-stranded-DNA-specific exonuclease RecJ [Candidatus Uhrbacteria bacterium]HCU31953.1 single-stranded-DNA-specific exonuclease RecJ [Candidatus Uhrbacteria bacterium]